MERLTLRKNYGVVINTSTVKNFLPSKTATSPIGQAVNRLADYEDTGLSPKEVSDLHYDHDEFRQMAKTVKYYHDAEEQGLLIKLPTETDKGNVTYIYSGSVWVVKLENIGHVISKRKITKFYPNYEAAEEALKGGEGK